MSHLEQPISFTVVLILVCLVSGLEDNNLTATGNGLDSPILNRHTRRAGSARAQPYFGPETPFPCPLSTRGPAGARSVHALRPQDVSVIGALGDSLVAGNGAKEDWALGTVFEYRGVSWAAGGDSNWREVMTFPNILREFNPRVTGFSTGTGEYRAPNSHMNIGFPVSSAIDALLQAKILVNRMKRDPKVNFKEDWKVITVFFGANDACSLECFNKELASASSFVRNIQQGLDYLQQNLPRTFVNLVSNIDVTVSVRVKRSPMCHVLHRLFCLCFHKGNYDHVSYLAKLAVSYQRGLQALVDSGRYDKKDDFTVVIQPFMKLFNLPREKERRYEEVIDTTFVTHDCFHFSQKGHALAANLLWNNMLEPIGNKTTIKMQYIMQRFVCPTERTPYFFTAKNSKTYFATGHQ